jgi:hypothetical protein
MSLKSIFSRSGAQRARTLFALLAAAGGAVLVSPPSAEAQAESISVAAPSPDRRVGLKAGVWDAGQAEWNMHLLSTTRPSGRFLGQVNTDLAFTGSYAIQGSYAG